MKGHHVNTIYNEENKIDQVCLLKVYGSVNVLSVKRAILKMNANKIMHQSCCIFNKKMFLIIIEQFAFSCHIEKGACIFQNMFV